MELRFLGQVYSANNNQIETMKTKDTARFLGQAYTPHRPVRSFKSQLGLRKYRGIAYGA